MSDGQGSTASVSGGLGDQLAWGGPRGRDLADALLSHAESWLAAGRPAMVDYDLRFVPRSGDDRGVPRPSPDSPPSWRISRTDHDELIDLRRDV